MDKAFKTKERIPWIDNVRFFAIVAVVVGHCLSMLTTEELPGAKITSNLIVAFNMPLFFFISGYVGGQNLMSTDNTEDWIKIFKRSLLRMILPVISFTIMLIPFHEVGSPLLYYWFLHSLFRLYIIIATSALIANYLCMNTIIKNICLIAVCIAASWFAGNFTMEFIFYFLLGTHFGQRKIVELLNSRHICLLLVIGFTIFPYIRSHSIYSEKALWAMIHIPHLWALRQICGISLSVGICGIFAKHLNTKNILTQMGTMTLGIYLIHDFIVEMILRDTFHWRMHLTNIWEWGVLLAFVVIIIAFCKVCIVTIRKNKYSKAIFLGELK